MSEKDYQNHMKKLSNKVKDLLDEDGVDSLSIGELNSLFSFGDEIGVKEISSIENELVSKLTNYNSLMSVESSYEDKIKSLFNVPSVDFRESFKGVVKGSDYVPTKIVTPISSTEDIFNMATDSMMKREEELKSAEGVYEEEDNNQVKNDLMSRLTLGGGYINSETSEDDWDETDEEESADDLEDDNMDFDYEEETEIEDNLTDENEEDDIIEFNENEDVVAGTTHPEGLYNGFSDDDDWGDEEPAEDEEVEDEEDEEIEDDYEVEEDSSDDDGWDEEEDEEEESDEEEEEDSDEEESDGWDEEEDEEDEEVEEESKDETFLIDDFPDEDIESEDMEEDDWDEGGDDDDPSNSNEDDWDEQDEEEEEWDENEDDEDEEVDSLDDDDDWDEGESEDDEESDDSELDGDTVKDALSQFGSIGNTSFDPESSISVSNKSRTPKLKHSDDEVMDAFEKSIKSTLNFINKK